MGSTQKRRALLKNLRAPCGCLKAYPRRCVNSPQPELGATLLRRIKMVMCPHPQRIKDEVNRGDWINARRELEENIRLKPDGYKEGRELEKGDQADVWTKPWIRGAAKLKVSPCWKSQRPLQVSRRFLCLMLRLNLLTPPLFSSNSRISKTPKFWPGKHPPPHQPLISC